MNKKETENTDDRLLQQSLSDALGPQPLSDEAIERMLDSQSESAVDEGQLDRISQTTRALLKQSATRNANRWSGENAPSNSTEVRMKTVAPEHRSVIRRNNPRGAAAALAVAAMSLIAVLFWTTEESVRHETAVAEHKADQLRQIRSIQNQWLTASLAPQVQLQRVQVGDVIETGALEQRRVGLPDGSVLFVNESATVRVATPRRMEVSRGEVFVEVVPQFDDKDEKAPFKIVTPERTVTALGTKFGVNASDNTTDVLVTQGSVQVSGVDDIVAAGQQLVVAKAAQTLQPALRASEHLLWTRNLMTASTGALVPASEYSGGAIITVDPEGQESKLSLRKYHVDVHIEDGFARTTIDQTYFNHTTRNMEGTFHFPLPPDASLSRLAMYVNGKLMEGGMAERQHARNTFEKIVHKMKDPALLEWVDGSTFKMRVFPLEARQEKRIVLSYTQRLNTAYGKTHYRFPAGHSMDVVKEWSTSLRVSKGAKKDWSSPSHTLARKIDGADLVLSTSKKASRLDRDLVLTVGTSGQENGRSGRKADSTASTRTESHWSRMKHEDQQYLMLRFRPVLPGKMERRPRHWVFLYEASADRNPILARTQNEIIRTLLDNAEHSDTFNIVTANTEATAFSRKPLKCSARNIAKAMSHLDQTHLIGALDLQKALVKCAELSNSDVESVIVHTGSAIPVLGEQAQSELLKHIPGQAAYVGVGVGKLWSRPFMKEAASQSGGYFTQINPDEELKWRAFELSSLLNTPRLLNVQVSVKDNGGRPVDSSRQRQLAADGYGVFLNFADTIVQGEEICAITRLKAKERLPKAVVISGLMNGKAWKQTVRVSEVSDGAEYLPRSWAKLQIDRLLADSAAEHKNEIIRLSKAMYVMSPFTSLLVLENEEMYTQHNIDRGRKDHWALYGCPPEIKVVHEPLNVYPQTANRLSEKRESVLGRIRFIEPPALVSWPQYIRVQNGKTESIVALPNTMWMSQPNHWAMPESSRFLGIDNLYGRSNDIHTLPLPAGVKVPAQDRFVREFAETLKRGYRGRVRQQPGEIRDSITTLFDEVKLEDRRQLMREQLALSQLSGVRTRFGRDTPLDLMMLGEAQNSLQANLYGEVQIPELQELELMILNGRETDVRKVEQMVERVEAEQRAQPIRMLALNQENPDSIRERLQEVLEGVAATERVDWEFQTPVDNSQISFTELSSISAYQSRFATPHMVQLSTADATAPIFLDLSLPQQIAVKEFGISLGTMSGSVQNLSYLPFSYPVYSVQSEVGYSTVPERNPAAQIIPNLGFLRGEPLQRQIALDGYDRFAGTEDLLFRKSRSSRNVSRFFNWNDDFALTADADSWYRNMDQSIRWDVGRASIVPALPRLTPNQQPTSAQVSDLHRWASAAKPDQGQSFVSLPQFGFVVQPVFGSDQRYFGDLISHAPGLNTSRADVLAFAESEFPEEKTSSAPDEKGRHDQSGIIDDAARDLIERSRQRGWEQVTYPASKHQKSLTVLCNGAGHYKYSRLVSEGLREDVTCDGSILTHTYSEIGLASERRYSRFHRNTIESTVPWLLPSADELARTADLLSVDDRTVAIVPRRPEKAENGDQQKTGDRNDVVWEIHLVFDDNGRLAERRLLSKLSNQIVWRVVFDADGTVRMLNAKEEEIASVKLKRETIEAPNLKLDHSNIVVLPMPIRSADSLIKDKSEDEKPDFSKWSKSDLLALILADLADNNGARVAKTVHQHFFMKNDKRDGFYVLLSRFPNQLVWEENVDGTNGQKRQVDLRPSPEGSPLRQFIRQYITWQQARGASGPSFAIERSVKSFVARMGTACNLYHRWSTGVATTDRTKVQVEAELKKALKFIATCRTDGMGWTLLSTIQPRVEEAGHHQLLAAAAAKYEKNPRLAWLARQERVRSLFKAGKRAKARQLYDRMLLTLIAQGSMPKISLDIREQYVGKNGAQEWSELMRKCGSLLTDAKLLRTAFLFSVQLRQFGDTTEADRILDDVLAAIGDGNRPDVSILAVEQLRQLSDGRAHRLVDSLLETESLRRSPQLWRYAAKVADDLGKKRTALFRLEQAILLEFESRPKVINVERLQVDYSELLTRFEDVIDAAATLETELPEDLFARVIRAADQWRSLEDDATTCCQATARVLSKLKRKNLAWSYLTTPLAGRSGESTPWRKLAENLTSQSEVELADMAWTKAFEFEKTNPEILLAHAKMLSANSRVVASHRLLKQIVDSNWQPRFARIQQEARSLLP